MATRLEELLGEALQLIACRLFGYKETEPGTRDAALLHCMDEIGDAATATVPLQYVNEYRAFRLIDKLCEHGCTVAYSSEGVVVSTWTNRNIDYWCTYYNAGDSKHSALLIAVADMLKANPKIGVKSL